MNARDIIGAARIRVVNKAPYFSCAVFKLRPVEKPGFGTLAVDKGGRLWFDPVSVAQWGTVAVAGVIYHEINHLIRRHHDRCGSRDPKQFNAATDLEINDTVVQVGFQLPKDPSGKTIGLFPKNFGFEEGLLAEEYYQKLRNRQSQPSQNDPNAQQDQNNETEKDDQSENQNRPAPGHGQCGGCTGNPWPEEQQGEDNYIDSTQDKDGNEVPPPLSESELEIMRKKTAEDVQRHAKSRGRVPGGLRKWSEEELAPPKVDYRKVFAKMVRGAITCAAGKSDYTYRRLGRSYAARKAILGPRTPISPSMQRPVPEVALVIDSSGSMGRGKGSPLHTVMEEVVGIVKAIGSPLRAFITDAEVGATAKVFSKRDIAKIGAYGGGGTNMPVGIKTADESKPRPDVIVCLTDGETNWMEPNEMPKATLIVVVIGDYHQPPQHIKNVVRVPISDLLRS